MQAIFNDVTIKSSGLVYSITYIQNDGTKYYREYYTEDNITDTSLTQTARGEIANYLANKQRKQSITVAPGSNISLAALPDPVPVPPTQDEIDKQAYFVAKFKVMSLKTLLDLKCANVTQLDLDTAVAAWNKLRFDITWEQISG